MIKQGEYLPKQMNGPVVNAFYNAVKNEFSSADAVISYLQKLSLDTAQETELENLGLIIGYPRPLVPASFTAENTLLLLGSIPIEYDLAHGLSTLDSSIGGEFTSENAKSSLYLNLGTYRQILKKVAIIKRRGITLKSIDEIASTFSQDYTITWDTENDVNVHFTKSIGYVNVWILTQIFYRIATEPQVSISSGALT